MQIHIDLAVLIAVVLFFRLRPSDVPRSQGSVQVTAALVLIFGLLIAGTGTGEILLNGVRGVAAMIG
jgi:hypothetical protein